MYVCFPLGMKTELTFQRTFDCMYVHACFLSNLLRQQNKYYNNSVTNMCVFNLLFYIFNSYYAHQLHGVE